MPQNDLGLPVYVANSNTSPVITQPATGFSQTVQSAPLTAGTDRSWNAGTTSTPLAPANSARRGINIQNISANTLGVNELGGIASIGSLGTYTLPPGATISIRTNRQINVIASAPSSAYTAVEF